VAVILIIVVLIVFTLLRLLLLPAQSRTSETNSSGVTFVQIEGKVLKNKKT